MKPMSLHIKRALLLALTAEAALNGQAMAADTDTNSDQISEVVVTGSLLRRQDTITPSPVTVISAEQIQNSGLTTVSDVVRSLSADNSGTIPTAFGGGFAAGASGVALRGLTVNSTLVLVDGRRVASYALSDDGERSFVDLNTLPLNAVDHIDVLRDGASSLYGADAIAGVVNIILRKTYQGAEVNAEAGTSQHGGGSTERISGTLGKGDLVNDNYNAYVDFEYQKDDRISVGDRGFPYNTNDLSPIGGSNLIGGQPTQFSGSTYGSVTPATLGTPGNLLTGTALPGAVSQPLRACGSNTKLTTDGSGNQYCAQDFNLYNDDQPAEERVGVVTRFTVQLDPSVQAYLTASFYQNTVTVDGGPGQIEAGVPNNTNTIALPPTLPNGSLNPNDPFAAQGEYALINYAFGDIPSQTTLRNRNERFVAGVKGSAGGWDYDSALVINHTALNTTQAGLISYQGLINAVTNGTYSFINPSQNTAAERAAISPVSAKVSTTDLDSLDFRATRSLLNLPGGPLSLGLGAEARYEAQFDPALNPDDIYQGLGIAQTEGSRDVYASYFELDAPVVKQLEVDASGRYDHYSDFGGKFVPKTGFKFTPLQQLIVRGTYSQGFRAPSFAENGSSSAEGFINYTPPASFQAAHGNDGYVQQYSLAGYTVANPNIKPETADNYTFGVVVLPTPMFEVDADYYYIKKKNVIAASNPSAALAAYYAGAPLPAGFSITSDAPDPAYPTAQARPIVVESPYVNQNSLSTDGLDLDIKAHFDIVPGLRYTSDVEATKIFSWKLIQSDGTSVQYVGTEGPYELSSGAGTPRYRGKWANTFNYGPATVSAIMYYTSGFYMYGPDVAPPPTCLYSGADGNAFPSNCHVPSFIDVDLTGSYKVTEQLTVSAAIENLLDRLPPFDPADYAGVNYNPTYAQAGIIGRYFRLGLSYKFR